MTWLDDLRAAALVGTGRHAAPAAPAELGVRPPDGLSREESLLDQAALADVATRAARRPLDVEASALPQPAGPDDVPQADGDAARLLDLLLTQPPVGLELRNQLVADWLGLAERARRRVPHRLLPALLTLAENKAVIAERLDPAIGTRGRWLQDLAGPAGARTRPSMTIGGMASSAVASGTTASSPAESSLAMSSPSQFEQWIELGSAEATAVLQRLRRNDPNVARELLTRHWDNLGARERAAHLAVFALNIQAADEELLERALDDKAKTVREIAAGLLDRLPGSSRAQRMAARLRPLLHVKGLLRKQFEIELPGTPDAAALRDGIAADPRTGEPDRLGRLDTIIRGAPLDVWTSASGRDPEGTLTLLSGEARVINAIVEAAVLRADVDWVRALLDVRSDARLLKCLPPGERQDAIVRLIQSGTEQALAVMPLLRDLPRPWGTTLANEVLALITSKKGGYLAAMVADFLPSALPPEAAEQCRRLLERADNDAPRRRVFRDVVQYQSFRQSLTEAFR